LDIRFPNLIAYAIISKTTNFEGFQFLPEKTLNRLRVAVVGAGYFAAFHHDAWHRMPEAELVAIADHDLDKAGTAAGKVGDVPVFTDLAEALAKTQPDLIDIATPPESHLALVELASAHHLPVICQKPLAPTFTEATTVVEVAEKAGSLLVVHENFRFQPWFREIKRLIDSGSLGALHGIAFRLRPGDGQGPEAYLDRQPYFQQMQRFLVHETAIHFIDTFRFLMGEVSAVTARLQRLNPHIAGEDSGYIIFDFKTGRRGMFDGNRLNDHIADNPRLTMGELWLDAENGVLRLDGDGRLWWKPHREDEREHIYVRSDLGFGGDCLFALQSHVVAHLRSSAPIENTGRAYLRNLEIEEAVYSSAEEGRTINL